MKCELFKASAVQIFVLILSSTLGFSQYQEQETNDDFPSANFVNLYINSEIIGDLGNGGDHKDIFKLSIPKYCKFKAIYNSTPNYQILMKLYNDTYDQLVGMPSFNTSGSDSIVYECLQAGIYYLEINDFIFNTKALPYTITLQMIDPLDEKYVDKEYNDIRDSAVWLNVQQVFPNQYELSIGGNLRYRKNNNVRDQNDWFVFVMPSYGAVLPPDTHNSNNQIASWSLLPDHGNDATDLFSSKQNYCLAPDTFYLRANVGLYGDCFSYSGEVRINTIPPATLEMEPNNSPDEAMELFGSDVDAIIGYYDYDQDGNASKDQEDYFKIVTTDEGDLVVTVMPKQHWMSFKADLISDRSRKVLPVTKVGNGQEGDTVIMTLRCTQADTFLLRIQHAGTCDFYCGCGNYYVSYELQRDSLGTGAKEVEPNDYFSEAQDITNTPVILSTIGHYDYSEEVVLIKDRSDYYRFVPKSEGDLRVIITRDNPAIKDDIVLLDSTNHVLMTEPLDTLIYPCASRVPYYLKIEGICAAYKLEWEILSDFDMDREPNDNIQEAIDFPVSTALNTVEGRLGAYQSRTQLNDVIDYYRVMMSSAGNLKLWFTGEDASGTLDVWTAGGIHHSEYSAPLSDSLEIDLGCLTKDTFFISVSTSSCVGYRVSAQIVREAENNDNEPNNTVAEAEEIDRSIILNGGLGGETISSPKPLDARDYYRLITHGHGEFTVKASLLIPAVHSALIMQILYSDGTSVYSSDTLREGDASQTFTCAQPDTLYIKLEQMLQGLECHTYTLLIDLDDLGGNSEPEPNDDTGTALPLADGQAQEGLIGFFRYGTADPDIGDVYRFDAVPGRVAIEFNTYQMLDSVYVKGGSSSQPNLINMTPADIPASGIYIDTVIATSNEPLYIWVEDVHECDRYQIRMSQVTAVGINDPGDHQNFAIYPNPASTAVQVSGIPVKKILVLDSRGRTVARSSGLTVDVSHLPAGIYQVRVFTPEDEIYQKSVFVINKD